MQILTAKPWREVGDFYGRVGAKIEGIEENGNPTGTPTESTTQEFWELSETEAPTKKPAKAGIRPLAHM